MSDETDAVAVHEAAVKLQADNNVWRKRAEEAEASVAAALAVLKQVRTSYLMSCPMPNSVYEAVNDVIHKAEGTAASRNFERKAAAVLEMAKLIAAQTRSWVDFSNEMFSQNYGIIGRIFTDSTERKAFRDSEQYKEIHELLLSIMAKFGASEMVTTAFLRDRAF